MSGFGQKLDALEKSAERGLALVSFWRQRVVGLGDEKAEALAKIVHSEHDHGETKSVEWEGLILGRQPTELETLFDLKGMAATFESQQAAVFKILHDLRVDLIKEAVTELGKADAGQLHAVVLTAPAAIKKQILTALAETYGKGRTQVSDELKRQRAAKGQSADETKAAGDGVTDDDDEILDELADLTITRSLNAVQSVATAINAGLRVLGLDGDDLETRFEQDLSDSSEAPLERAAREAANLALSMGRTAEANDRQDEWERVEYSALLDANTCSPCEDADGETAATEDELPDAPNPDCEGQGQCRCFHVFVVV